MLQRRIRRRMRLRQIEQVSEYVDFLRAHPEEVDRLFKDLLIGVTRFFRDPSAFDELATRVMATLVKGTSADSPVRIWVPGCATGEEAYSLAIVAAEQVAAAGSRCRVQIFATDLDEDAIGIARAGVYPESIALDVTPERLARFFTRDDHRYVIAKSIRESVVFAVQNVIGDPPFSNLDLVSCRNVLIYLAPSVYERLMSLFQFALKPGGYLFLGSAESAKPRGAWSDSLSTGAQIFQRLGTAKHPRPLHPSSQAPEPHRVAAKGSQHLTAATLANQVLLAHLAPSAVVVTGSGQIAHLYGAMDRYITLPAGEATLDVVTLAHDPLKPPMRAALQEAAERNRPAAVEVDVRRGKTRVVVRITVWPLDAQDATEHPRLIMFEELSRAPRRSSRRPAGKPSAHVRRIAAELAAARREHRRLIEQFEHSNEKLEAANSEVLSTNEELQSTNEELVTSQEELQSVNEELATLNATLQEKVQEVIAASDDLPNLFASTDIGTVFVDEALEIKRFTPPAGRLLNLRSSDVGRPLSDLATNLVDVDMVRDARAVLTSLEPIQEEVQARDGTHYLLRILPYRSGNGIVQGVVLTLSDVTSFKKTQEELVAAKTQLSIDLGHMYRLHALGTRLSRVEGLSSLLDDAVGAAIEITNADMGYIHVVDESGALELAAQGGCPQPLLEFVHRLLPGGASIEAVALARGERVVVEDVARSPLLSDASSLAVLLAADVRAVQSTPLLGLSGDVVGTLSTHNRTAQTIITDGNLRWLDLLARQAADVIERRRLEEMRQRAKNGLKRRVKERTKWLTLLHDISQAIDQAPNWSDAVRLVINRICESEGWQGGHVYAPAVDAPHQLTAIVSYSTDPRFDPFQIASQQARHPLNTILPGRVFVEGHHVWINGEEALVKVAPERRAAACEVGLQSLVALPVRVGNATLAVFELFSDRSHPETDELVSLMNDVSTQVGRVLEQENMMTQISDIVWGEQQDLVHTLHDSLGQQFTGLGMLAASLKRRLDATDIDAAQTAQQIAGIAQDSLERVRQLARGLFQGDIDGDSFLKALEELAAMTRSMHNIGCRVEGDAPLTIHTARVATQLYRIVQEAITNAVRHANARQITIRAQVNAGTTTLTVTDDGVGFDHRMPNEGGMGLRIMRHRAASIGAVLSVGAGVDGGTVVKVVARDTLSLPGHESRGRIGPPRGRDEGAP
jgi:two-component system CheB/CheR fusion protein